jgi:uncharacterized protein (TIGR03435 family)
VLHLQHMLLLQQSIMISFVFAVLLLLQNFEAASGKSVATPGNGRFTMNGGPGTNDPGLIRYSNVPLKRVLMIAYDVKSWQVLGPDWLNSSRFDISARVPEGATKEQALAMMRKLLEERFQMIARREAKEMAFYALVADKNGAKLKSSTSEVADDSAVATVKKNEGKDGFPILTPGAAGLVIETRNGSARVSGFKADLLKLADFLANRLGRPVLNQTAIAGDFDFALYFAADNPAPGEVSPYADLFQALREQLGLRLDARRGPVERFVIDRIEKVPP